MIRDYACLDIKKTKHLGKEQDYAYIWSQKNTTIY